jgi:hypothetical protein
VQYRTFDQAFSIVCIDSTIEIDVLVYYLYIKVISNLQQYGTAYGTRKSQHGV